MFGRLPFFRKHEINEVKRFIEQQDNAFGYGSTIKLSHSQSPTPCSECEELMDLGSTCIYIKRADHSRFWHPQCFICTQCKKFLVNSIYFYKDGQIYCQRHHSDLYKLRYTGCDLIVFNFEDIEVEGYVWNMYQICCSKCQELLNGERYIMRKCQPFCLNCFETMFPEHCDTCCERISPDQAKITYESHQWHATETCFCCYNCLIPLNDSSFLQDYGVLFCLNKCASQLNNNSIDTKLIHENKYHQDPDIIPTSYIDTNKHIISHGKKDYLSDGIDTRHRDNRNYQTSIFVQDQTLPNSIYSNSDLNLKQVNCRDAALEIPCCSTSISTSLPYSIQKSFPISKIKNYPTISQHTLLDQAPSNWLQRFNSNGIMFLVSRSKSRITSHLPPSRSLHDSSKFTKQYRVDFIVDDNQEGLNSMIDQLCIYGNHLQKSINSRRKIIYDDNETSTINSRLMKKTTILNKQQKKSDEGRRKKDFGISSLFCIPLKSLH